MPRTRKQTASSKKQIRISRKPATVRKINKILGVAMIILGITLFSFPTFYKNIRNSDFSKNSNPQKTNRISARPRVKNSEPIKIDSQLLSDKEQVEPPSRIVVPALKVDLPIVEAKVVNGFWELSETSASHGVGSSNPGQLGNIVIFAHARDDLFGPLRNIKQSTMIYILTQDRWFRYEVKETKLVDPGDIQVIASTTDETLTLYTCDGFLDSNRLIITAKPQK